MSNNIIRVNKVGNYTVLANEPLNDQSISWKAKGLLVYLLSRPDNWQVNPEQLRKASLGGRDAIYSMLKELIDAGYIVRRCKKSQHGKIQGYEYTVFESKSKPFPEKAYTELPFTEKPDINKDCTIVNTDNTNSGEPPKKSIEEKIKESKVDFCRKIISFVSVNPNKYPKSMYVEFASYWMEANSSGTKMRFQREKFFDLGRRLSTWKGNCKTIKEHWEAEHTTDPLNKLLKKLL